MYKVAVSVVCYNNENEVINFARLINKQIYDGDIKLFITLNKCKNSEKFEERVKECYFNSEVIIPNKNKGYLKGCLLGAKNKEFDYILICNTDISFDENLISKLVKEIRDNVWCVGPDIVLKKNGQHQNPFLVTRPSKNKIKFWRFIYSNLIIYNIYVWMHSNKNRIVKNKVNNFTNEKKEVYAVHGSCFLISKDCFDYIVMEKSDIFMYGEELFIAEIVRENKKKCMFNSNIKVIHNENQVTGFVGNRKKQKWLKNSFRYINKRFFVVK